MTKTAVLLAGGLFSLHASGESVDAWLSRMADALSDTSYSGVLIREQDGRPESLKIYHSVRDGVVRERLVAQEGSGFEIIRNGDEVHCVLPDKRAVLVEDWDEGSTLFSSLPTGLADLDAVYDVTIDEKQRVAGRQALLLSIEPRDDLRFAKRIWLDTETGFPLKTQLVDTDGSTLEQMVFADIELGAEIAPEDLDTDHDLSTFKWYPDPGKRQTLPATMRWTADALPLGFAMESSHEEAISGGDEKVTHIIFSDGLSKVSVFIETAAGEARTLRSRVGPSHSFSTVVDAHQVTAVGEVPAATVERIALSIRPQP